MAVAASLSTDEEELLGHYRRLKKLGREFKLEVFGRRAQGRLTVQVRPAAYYDLVTETVDEDTLE